MKKSLSILILLFLFISCEELPKQEIVGECDLSEEELKERKEYFELIYGFNPE